MPLILCLIVMILYIFKGLMFYLFIYLFLVVDEIFSDDVILQFFSLFIIYDRMLSCINMSCMLVRLIIVLPYY